MKREKIQSEQAVFVISSQYILHMVHIKSYQICSRYECGITHSFPDVCGFFFQKLVSLTEGHTVSKDVRILGVCDLTVSNRPHGIRRAKFTSPMFQSGAIWFCIFYTVL